MERSAPRGEVVEYARFRRLTGVTIVATLILILIGGIVRVSDSGLGCGPAGSGTHGWPLCQGGALPGLESTALIEFSHRVAATVVAVLIGLLIFRAFRGLRDQRRLTRGTVAAGLLVLAQAGLGGLTVEEGLHEVLVAAHLGLAMVLLGVLILVRRFAAPDDGFAPARAQGGAGESPRGATAGLRALVAVAAGLVLATVVAGGLVAGTEGEGTSTEPVLGAHTACGEQFPACAGRFMPFGEDRLIDIQLTHRAFMYLATIAVLAMVVVALRRRVRPRTFAAIAAILLAQVALGALNVWLGEHPGLIVAHLALGTTLWAGIVYVGAALMAVRSEVPRDLRGAQPATGTAGI